MNGALGWNTNLTGETADQQITDLARAPMRLAALEADDEALNLRGELIGIAHRPMGSIGQRGTALVAVAVEDFIAGLREVPNAQQTSVIASPSTTRPPGMNSLQQQARLRSSRNSTQNAHARHSTCSDPPTATSRQASLTSACLNSPTRCTTANVSSPRARICMHRKKINISTVLAGQKLGLKEVDDGIWLVSFTHYDLGYIEPGAINPATHRQPFGSRLSPMA